MTTREVYVRAEAYNAAAGLGEAIVDHLLAVKRLGGPLPYQSFYDTELTAAIHRFIDAMKAVGHFPQFELTVEAINKALTTLP